MATLEELYGIRHDSTLLNKIKQALIHKAETVISESGVTTNHANRVILAKRILKDVELEYEPFVRAIIATNKAATIAQITGAADATIESQLGDTLFNFFADGS